MFIRINYGSKDLVINIDKIIAIRPSGKFKKAQIICGDNGFFDLDCSYDKFCMLFKEKIEGGLVEFLELESE